MSKTRIEWTEHSWNPVTGCSPISQGCDNCYAERRARQLAGRASYPPKPHHFDVVLRPDRLDIPLKRKKPTMYLLLSMGDLFHIDVKEKWLWRIFKIMAAADRHTFQILTKRPHRMLQFCQSKWYQALHHTYGLDNIWFGVSIESPEYSYRASILAKTPAAIRFISFAPLLASFADYPGVLDNMDWAIVEGESGKGARPMQPNWAREIRDRCKTLDIPFFFKQWGAWFPRSQWEHNPDLHLPSDSDYIPPRFLTILDDEIYHRTGKKRAGRLLDGQEWNEMPL